MAYAIELRPQAERALDKLSTNDERRVRAEIAKLAETPRPQGSKKLVGGDGERRVRVGVYRVIYDVDDRARVVVVLTIGHRSKVYR